MNRKTFTLHTNGGFTLLEVMLFLAISAALIIIAVIGLAPRLRNVRFTQSVKATETAITEKFSASASGANNRSSNFTCKSTTAFSVSVLSIAPSPAGDENVAGGSENCVVNGALVVFEQGNMVFYSIVSLREPKPGAPESCKSVTTLDNLLTCYTPRVTGKTNEPPEKQVVAFKNGVTSTSSIQMNNKPLAFGTIQNPNSTDRYQFFHLNGDLVMTSQAQLWPDNTEPAVAQPYACLKLDSRIAKIRFSADSIKPVVTYEGCTV